MSRTLSCWASGSSWRRFMTEQDTITDFGTTPDGQSVKRVRIEGGGLSAHVITWGASLQDLRLEGHDGGLVLGADTFEPYLGTLRFCGAVVGPVANRIAKGRAPLNGRVLELATNEGDTTLHGGPQAIGQQNWALADHGTDYAVMRLDIADGMNGFAGPISLNVRYAIEEGALVIAITGQSTRPVLLNPAHHGYWSLGARDLSQCRLAINADRYLPVDDKKIPLGAPAPVAGSVFDYRTAADIADVDHNFCLNAPDEQTPWACQLESDRLRMQLFTDAPGLQVYNGAHLPDPFGPRRGLALEPQFWPDAPNQAGYPPIVTTAEAPFSQTSRFTFSRLDI
ncbi:galactose mutarotase [Rhodobacteraceae bacterium]|nr:galactose mutarotase [Paracoccaceae bacterium]